VFVGEVGDDRALSLRAASDVLGDLGFEALLPLLRARTVDDVDTALDHWVEPVNNVVVADRHGAVRYRLAGRVPLRAEGNRLGIVDAADPETAWTGWLDDAHRVDVPADGQVVTANERRGPESEAVGTTFAPPHRAGRLHALLAGRTGLTPGDLAAMHGDVLLPALDLYRRLLEPLRPGPEGKPVRDLVLGWDGRMEAGSAGAAAFAAWRGALVRRLAAQPVFAPLAEPVVDDPVLAPWLDPVARIGAAVEGLVAAGTPFGIDLPDLATRALDDAADHAASWGQTHTFFAAHAFDVVAGAPEAPALPEAPVGGDIDCVRCTGSLPGIDDSAWRGSVARYVWDLADPAGSGWVVPLGAAGDPRSPHHADQLPLWVAAELAPVETGWDRLAEETP
jgi:penicillin amidase